MSKVQHCYTVGAEFWGQFVPEDKRSNFVAFLAELWQKDKGVLYSDYDPDDRLCEALNHVGIECRGCLFSAEDVGFPEKTRTQILNGVCHVKQGYGQPWEPVAVYNN